MLYDVLPPLILFLSFGGIVLIVSRVALRIRHKNVSQQIHTEMASQNSGSSEELLRSKKTGKGVRMVRNRASLMMEAVKSNVSQTKDLVSNKSATLGSRIRRRDDDQAGEKEPEQPERPLAQTATRQANVKARTRKAVREESAGTQEGGQQRSGANAAAKNKRRSSKATDAQAGKSKTSQPKKSKKTAQEENEKADAKTRKASEEEKSDSKEVEHPLQSGTGIQIPESNMRDRMSEFASRSKERLTSWGRSVAASTPKPRMPQMNLSRTEEQNEPRSVDDDEQVEIDDEPAEKPRSRVRRSVQTPATQEQPRTAQDADSEDTKPKQQEASVEPEQPAAHESQDGGGLLANLLGKEPPRHGPLHRAQDCLRSSQYEQAEDILLPYLMEHAKDADAYVLLGQAAIGKEEWEDAVEIFQQVQQMNGDRKGINAALGHAAMHAGKVTLAMEALQRARDEEPGNKQVLRELLTIAQRMDNKVLEKSVLEDLANLEPDYHQKKVKVTQ